jgi:hypothetical protein
MGTRKTQGGMVPPGRAAQLVKQTCAQCVSDCKEIVTVASQSGISCQRECKQLSRLCKATIAILEDLTDPDPELTTAGTCDPAAISLVCFPAMAMVRPM